MNPLFYVRAPLPRVYYNTTRILLPLYNAAVRVEYYYSTVLTALSALLAVSLKCLGEAERSYLYSLES